MHDAASYSREDSLFEFVHSCEALSCLFFAAEKLGTRQHGVSACSGVAFLGNQQLPPEHVGVVERSLLTSRKERAVELHARSTLWSHRNRHTTVF